ncbi:MAG: hypothetical protein HYV45_00215 [Candidatus Moranbacteria bacterium]|nr:hypothetical protein [Candidatus Moranbacteria bacterium]
MHQRRESYGSDESQLSGGNALVSRILSQKKYLLTYKLFFEKSLFFSIISLVFVGVISFFPGADGVSGAVAQEEKKQSDKEGEWCRWREDVQIFSSFLGNDDQKQSKISCSENRALRERIEKQSKAHVSKKDTGEKQDIEAMLEDIVVGYPIEKMIPTIATYDREIAALLIGIAKKESNWGKRVPLDKNGDDCFNYWGYKGAGSRGVAMGHSCFGSREEAVKTVGNRLAKLVELKQTSDPKHLIVWKCGSSCKGHSSESVKKWISDVDLYYRKITEQERL